jgi:hypothetical protein
LLEVALGRKLPQQNAPARHAVRVALARNHVEHGVGTAPRCARRRLRSLTRQRTSPGWRPSTCTLSKRLMERLTMTLPDRAQIVVIGGGIIGCSTAYHLARDHKADVLLLEQGQLTSGSTWHAAGLVGQLRSSASITKVLKYSVDLYKRLTRRPALRPAGRCRAACGWPPIRTAGPNTGGWPRPRSFRHGDASAVAAGSQGRCSP